MDMQNRNIRFDLQEAINEINEENSIYNQDLNCYYIYEAICGMFDSDDLDKLLSASLTFPLLYEVIVPKEEAESLGAEMYECLSYIKKIKEKDLQDFYDTKRKVKRFNSIIGVFKEKRDILESELSKKRKELKVRNELRKEYCFLKSKLDHDGLLSEEDIRFLSNYMIERGFDRIEQIYALEYIRVHNQRIKHPDYKISNTVKNMLRETFHEIKITKLQSLLNAKYQSDIFSYLKALSDSPLEEVIKVISDAEKQYEDKEHYLFIIKSLVNDYVVKLNGDVQDLKDNYEDLELRKVIIATYNEHKRVYAFLRKLYYEKIEKAKENVETQIEVNELYYAGKENSYLEKDLKNVREEKYLEVKDLLIKKKLGILSRDQDDYLRHNSKLTGLKELRGDQVRICYRHVGYNRNVILGVFIKKDDNDPMYEIMADRKNDVVLDTEEHILQELLISQNVEQRLFDYIDKNYRKGSR